VALLHLLFSNEDLRLHVVHLDHETRQGVSARDAEFVRRLAEQLGLPITLARRGDIEATMKQIPGNLSARYRAARYALFERVVREQGLSGVILGHHADDQAETILQRLLRGSGPAGLAGMAFRSRVRGVEVLRPLLKVRRRELRDYLLSRGLSWREDASNLSDDYQRNRIRRVLEGAPEVHEPLLRLGEAARNWRKWLEGNTPELADSFSAKELARLSLPLARHAASRWLRRAGCPSEDLSPAVLDRLIEMARDAASPNRQHFPGKILVQRRRGIISALASSPENA
jgi:tRNA(Ile)-lysidine synthase